MNLTYFHIEPAKHHHCDSNFRLPIELGRYADTYGSYRHTTSLFWELYLAWLGNKSVTCDKLKITFFGEGFPNPS